MNDDLGTIVRDGDRWTLRFERSYDARREELWAALTEPERLARWLAPGGVADGVHLEFGPDDVVTGRLLAFEPPTLLEYEWRFAGEHESIVRFELHEDGPGTRLVLEHRRLASGHGIGYAAGWHAYLEQLGGGETAWDDRFAELLPRYRASSAAASASISTSDLPRERAMRS
jgi:uncharacterized protein YndB with AHSA1/START domain